MIRFVISFSLLPLSLFSSLSGRNIADHGLEITNHNESSHPTSTCLEGRCGCDAVL